MLQSILYGATNLCSVHELSVLSVETSAKKESRADTIMHSKTCLNREAGAGGFVM